jgi:hypothetical protein
MNNPIVIQSLGSENNSPYFYKSPEIDNHVYIVQTAYNIPNALYIIDVWNKENYNCGKIERYIDSNIDMPYNLYSYENANTISKEEKNGGDNDYKVMICKYEGKVYTYALLKYS